MKPFLTILIGLISFWSPAQKATFTSVYDEPEFAERLKSHKESLRKMESVFVATHDSLFKQLPENHKVYFTRAKYYKLFDQEKGDLFQNQKEDYVFMVYDTENARVSVVVYNQLENTYNELFRPGTVEDGLAYADCNHSSSPDYDLAEALIRGSEFLLKNPLDLIEYGICKIVDIEKDDDFAFDMGCYTTQDTKQHFSGKVSLCISTSRVYNNWACLQYDKTEKLFVHFYGQEFAD